MTPSDNTLFDADAVEVLIVEHEWHYLDIVPFTFTNPASIAYVDHLESGEHLDRFARKVAFVYLGLAFEYGGQIYIGDASCFLDTHPQLRANQNITALDPALIERIIVDVIVSMCGTITIIVEDLKVLIDISGGFQNAVYGANSQFLNHLKLLAGSQGLFLKHYVNGTRTLL
ncbi:hypothetical protein [Arcanobacterium hippocoleae]|uniref:Uncharacterized protein n=1 Tax=Arcanobacterium hippocoleae TaxID=149017 RepID=A0ABU1T297_9ACTO|nr:hypothetical protein [Arcanobacterium hippocoleae]MDR6939380.1 hypothetical protein [Arcanobacterium hippocoleae]